MITQAQLKGVSDQITELEISCMKIHESAVNDGLLDVDCCIQELTINMVKLGRLVKMLAAEAASNV